MNYFKVSEFINSSKAKQLDIDNSISYDICKNIERLIDFINPLREAWGSAIIVTSGYRTELLNIALKGSKTSAHLTGNAVDLVPANGNIKEFKQFVKEWAKDKQYDQIIPETNGTSEWLHIGLYNNEGKQRLQIFEINK